MFDVNGAAIVAPKMQFRPFGDRILIRPLEEGDRTASGLLVRPDIAKEAPQSGVVIATGPGRTTESGTLIPMHVAPGDHVSYGKYSGTRVTIDEEELLVIRVTDCLGLFVEVVEGAVGDCNAPKVEGEAPWVDEIRQGIARHAEQVA